MNGWAGRFQRGAFVFLRERFRSGFFSHLGDLGRCCFLPVVFFVDSFDFKEFIFSFLSSSTSWKNDIWDKVSATYVFRHFAAAKFVL